MLDTKSFRQISNFAIPKEKVMITISYREKLSPIDVAPKLLATARTFDGLSALKRPLEQLRIGIKEQSREGPS